MEDEQQASRSNSRSIFHNFAIFLERLPNKKPFKGFSNVVKSLTQIFYNLVSSFLHDEQLIFMNYGYVSFDPYSIAPDLTPEDENFRYQIQMYHHIASVIDWTGLDALEVGSGRGGGASYIKHQFKPKSMIGVDLSNKAVAFCNQHYASVEGLLFVQGDAEALQFPNETFDVIINIESSLYYPNVEGFFKHVVRLLKPNGYFLYADMRFQDELTTWRRQLKDTGLKLLSEEDITRNVRHALALSQEYRRVLIEKNVPRLLHRLASRFGGSDGGRLAETSGEDGKRVYKNFVFRKSE